MVGDGNTIDRGRDCAREVLTVGDLTERGTRCRGRHQGTSGIVGREQTTGVCRRTACGAGAEAEGLISLFSRRDDWILRDVNLRLSVCITISRMRMSRSTSRARATYKNTPVLAGVFPSVLLWDF